MNNRSLFRAVVVGVLVLAGAAAIATGAYNWGLAQGIAESGRAVVAPPAGAPYVYVWPRPWGFGFFPVFPLLFLFLFFFVVRGMLWRGPGRGGWGSGCGGAPPAFDEWHRRAHAADREAARPSGGSA